jgi:hypothetical protein
MHRRSIAIALFSTAAAALVPAAALAKESFNFVSTQGADLRAEVRSSDPVLTSEFFAFADISAAPIAAPAAPGIGCEITRYYIHYGGAQAFDRLHYYPAADAVYYDGLVSGYSEYDGHWYGANPAVKETFERIVAPRRQPGPVPWVFASILGLFLLFAASYGVRQRAESASSQSSAPPAAH